MLEPDRANLYKAAHIYYNAVTGERIVTLAHDQVQAADTGTSNPIWASDVHATCPGDPGYSVAYFFGVDNPNPTDPLSTAITVLDYGDTAADTVVDCFEVNWVTSHPDVDSDSDSVGDGVEELAARWIIWDAHNGRPDCTALPLIDILFFNLPGNVFGPGSATGYSFDVDLVGFGSSTDLTFEICDTDGDCQSAEFCYSSIDYDSDSIPDGPIGLGDRNFDGIPDSDLDSDGLADFGWSVRFYQPGTGNDFDSDSDTGSAAPVDSDTIGVSFGAPEGQAIDNGDGTWTWKIDTLAAEAGTGQEDRLALYDQSGVYVGGFDFGGFFCPDEFGGEPRPPAMLEFVLYGPGSESGRCIPICPADLNGDNELNFFDVSLFIQGYQAGEDYNGDGDTSFFDVSQFIQDYNAGCP